ncbi:hypothetical protein B296_00009581 [Ensete ventricosum]|uniref:Uncharacterized protein n=1 Tax=Ensete ventricosum TaxID=4639 RepID=A0A427B9C2_ENSVE|nr:hypothetical protein B296_00009581 [Ensete ventricosum]
MTPIGMVLACMWDSPIGRVAARSGDRLQAWCPSSAMHNGGDRLRHGWHLCAQEVRGIANLKNIVLIQELVCGRWSVYGHPKENYLENIGVLKPAVERVEEATTSPEGLRYPKVKCRSKRRWTRRSAPVPQRRIY